MPPFFKTCNSIKCIKIIIAATKISNADNTMHRYDDGVFGGTAIFGSNCIHNRNIEILGYSTCRRNSFTCYADLWNQSIEVSSRRKKWLLIRYRL